MASLDSGTKKTLVGALVPGALDIAYEAGYRFAGFPDIPTIGKGSGGFRLPNLDDCLIDLGIPLLAYLAEGKVGDYTKGALAFGIPMFLFNTWRMTADEIQSGGTLATRTPATAKTTILGSQPMGMKNGKRQTPSIAMSAYADNILLV